MKDDYNTAEIECCYRLLTAIIKTHMIDYETHDPIYYEKAKKFFFANIGKVKPDGSPKNRLEYLLQHTNISAEYIRDKLKKPKR